MMNAHCVGLATVSKITNNEILTQLRNFANHFYSDFIFTHLYRRTNSKDL